MKTKHDEESIKKLYETYCRRMRNLKLKHNINDSAISTAEPISYKEFRSNLIKKEVV